MNLLLFFQMVSCEVYEDDGYIPEPENPIAELFNVGKNPSFEDEDLINKPRTCGPHASLQDTTCLCDEGYPYGNPNSKKGCYNCTEECSKWGFCEYPGFCRCIDGDNGNGTYCWNNKPEIKSFTKMDETTMRVGIVFKSDSLITGGFCKYGTTVVSALIADTEKFICPIPFPLTERIRVQVSMDGETWSVDNAVYDPEKETIDNSEDDHVVWAVVFVAAMLLLTLYILGVPIKENEEAQPFIRERPRQEANGVRRRYIEQNVYN